MSLGSKKTKVPAQGFFALPKGYRDAYNASVNNLSSQISGIDSQMLDPSQGVTAGAFGQLMQGFTPTAETLGQDINMLMNPYNDSVIGLINREAQGQNSVLNQALNRSGQMGSNRAILGASDIEQNRLNNIGAMQQGQYNTALSQILNNLVPQRQSDAMGAFGVGQQSEQAPLQALLAQGGLLSSYPTSFGNFGQEAYTIKSGGGLGGLVSGLGSLGGLASGIGGGISAGLGASAGGAGLGSSILTGLAAFSDENLKENIKHVGGKNGLRLYEFNYKANNPLGLPSDTKYIGVLAQEVMEVMPESVQTIDGFLAVDYDKIGIEMKEVADGH